MLFSTIPHPFYLVRQNIEKDMKKKQIVNNLNSQFNMEFSDDSDADLAAVGGLRANFDEKQRKREQEEEKRIVEQTKRMTVNLTILTST